jgi:sugar-specific transcriptional regulator TrmB
VQGDPRLAVLGSFGLEGYLARAYLALLDLGAADARQVADRSGVPQGRVYDVLEKLHGRGLADVLPETPKRYRATPFAIFLERELQTHHERMAFLEKQRRELLSGMGAPEAARAEPASYLVLRGRAALVHRTAELVQGAQREVMWLGSEGLGLRLSLAEGAMRHALGRGVRTSLLLPVTPSNRAMIEAAARLGAEVRHIPSGAAAASGLLVADGARVLMSHADPDDASGAQGDATAVVVEEPRIAEGLRALVEDAWFRGVALAERLRELDTGRAAGEVRVCRRRVDTVPAVEAAMGLARREVMLMGLGWLLHQPAWAAALEEAGRRGVRLRCVLGPADASVDPAALERLRGLGAEMRVLPRLHLAAVVCDDAEACIGVSALLQRVARGQASEAMMLWCDGADFVASLAEEFEAAWAEAERERLAEARGPPPAA